MAYSRWASSNELKNLLTKDDSINKSGLPMYYDEEGVYVNTNDDHNLIIGNMNSNKDELVVLPTLKYASNLEESFIVSTNNKKVIDSIKPALDKKGYEIITIDFSNPLESNKFNPLILAYELYKSNKDLGVEVVDKVAHYLFASEEITNVDPFWENSATSLFSGLILYMFEKCNKEDLTLKKVYELALDLDKIEEDIKDVSKTSPLFINLNSVLKAPVETKDSIVSVFMQNIRLYVTRESLANMLGETNFSLDSIRESKKAIFITCDGKRASSRLVSILLEELNILLLRENSNKNVNIILDDFENIYRLKNVTNILLDGRSKSIKYTVIIKSYLELRNKYGNTNAELLKLSFGNIIYLLANDNDTLEEISKLCGNTLTDIGVMPLVTIEDLKLLGINEAIILVPRIYPIKTKLIPFDSLK